jgi:hypothetical protein
MPIKARYQNLRKAPVIFVMSIYCSVRNTTYHNVTPCYVGHTDTHRPWHVKCHKAQRLEGPGDTDRFDRPRSTQPQMVCVCRSSKLLMVSPARSFLVPGPAGLITVFLCLTTLYMSVCVCHSYCVSVLVLVCLCACVYVCLYHSVQISSGAHPVSYPMGTSDSFSRDKAAVMWSWPLTSVKWQVKKARNYISAPPYAFVEKCLIEKRSLRFLYIMHWFRDNYL